MRKPVVIPFPMDERPLASDHDRDVLLVRLSQELKHIEDSIEPASRRRRRSLRLLLSTALAAGSIFFYPATDGVSLFLTVLSLWLLVQDVEDDNAADLANGALKRRMREIRAQMKVLSDGAPNDGIDPPSPRK
jgi:cell division protein FtsB